MTTNITRDEWEEYGRLVLAVYFLYNGEHDKFNMVKQGWVVDTELSRHNKSVVFVNYNTQTVVWSIKGTSLLNVYDLYADFNILFGNRGSFLKDVGGSYYNLALEIINKYKKKNFMSTKWKLIFASHSLGANIQQTLALTDWTANKLDLDSQYASSFNSENYAEPELYKFIDKVVSLNIGTSPFSYLRVMKTSGIFSKEEVFWTKNNNFNIRVEGDIINSSLFEYLEAISNIITIPQKYGLDSYLPFTAHSIYNFISDELLEKLSVDTIDMTQHPRLRNPLQYAVPAEPPSAGAQTIGEARSNTRSAEPAGVAGASRSGNNNNIDTNAPRSGSGMFSIDNDRAAIGGGAGTPTSSTSWGSTSRASQGPENDASRTAGAMSQSQHYESSSGQIRAPFNASKMRRAGLIEMTRRLEKEQELTQSIDPFTGRTIYTPKIDTKTGLPIPPSFKEEISTERVEPEKKLLPIAPRKQPTARINPLVAPKPDLVRRTAKPKIRTIEENNFKVYKEVTGDGDPDSKNESYQFISPTVKKLVPKKNVKNLNLHSSETHKINHIGSIGRNF